MPDRILCMRGLLSNGLPPVPGVAGGGCASEDRHFHRAAGQRVGMPCLLPCFVPSLRAGVRLLPLALYRVLRPFELIVSIVQAQLKTLEQDMHTFPCIQV